MSKETASASRDASISRNKVSLRNELHREDSGYLSTTGTPAGTPSVMNGRRQSRVDVPRDCQTLQGIPEGSSEQEGTTDSSPAPKFYTGARQQSVPDDEKTFHSAPMAYGGLAVPHFNRSYSYSVETGNYYMSYLEGKRKVSKKAEQIISKFEKMRMDSNESVNTQSPLLVEQTGEQYIVPEAQPVIAPIIGLQRQFSEFPLDQTVLTPGQDGYYLEDRDYNIVRQAGTGGSASCNLGNDKVKNSQFVIKRPKKSYSEEEKQDVMRESRLLKEIEHDNVIRFYGLVEDLSDHCFKIFLEFADETCGDIHYLFCESDDKENFSGNIALIMLYVQQMLFAVDYLHWETGILHLDIKGKNIVVCNSGYRVKLIDFGTACKVNGAQPKRHGWTPVFAAPEVNNQSDTPRFSADIWSVMCVAVEMVTGALPWPKVMTEHEAAVFKVGFYEDHQITELVEYDEYREKYNYHPDHYDMYQELVLMWKLVFRKDSSSRPAANQLLNLKWMKEMELNGEGILNDLVSGGEQPCVEGSYPLENEPVGIQINHTPIDYSYAEDSLSAHSFSQPSHGSYQTNSPHLQGYVPSGGHSPVGSDSEPYYDCSSSFNGRYLTEPHYIPSGPSSLPAYMEMHHTGCYGYQKTSTPMVNSDTQALNRPSDFTDGRDNNLSGVRGRSRSFSMQGKPPELEQVTGKRRKSLCYIGTSKSDPINVLNASGMMDIINKANVKRVNSLTYVMEGPKTDSPVNSPKVEQKVLQSLVPGTVKDITPQQPRRRLSSDVESTGNAESTGNMDSGYGDSLKERFIRRRSTSLDHTTYNSSPRLSLPDRDQHKPDGCSEPSEATPHTLQISSPTTKTPKQVEVNGSTTVTELIKMTQHSKQSDSIIVKLDSTA